MSGQLDVVATPIGNLADASARMQSTLAEADVVLVEDTRHSGRLLQQFGVKKPLFALHEHNEADVVPALLERLTGGERMALISDAGTPAISDPGFRLVRAAQAAGIRVSPVPGPNAAVAALSVAGLATDRFVFEGFLPAKAAARRARLQSLAAESRTMVFYESVHRIEALLADCVAQFSAARRACIARELTKLHEQVVVDELGSLQRALATGQIVAKGEFVLLVAGQAAPTDSADAGVALLHALLDEGVSLRVAARVAARITGAARNELYELGLRARD